MKILIGFCLLFLTPALSAQAGQPSSVIKYNVENGVKVYRNDLSPQQQYAQIRQQQAAAHAAQERANQAARRNAEIAAQTAANNSYNQGFNAGVAQAQKLADAQKPRPFKRNRYGYGRRYSTSYYPYGRRGVTGFRFRNGRR